MISMMNEAMREFSGLPVTLLERREAVRRQHENAKAQGHVELAHELAAELGRWDDSLADERATRENTEYDHGGPRFYTLLGIVTLNHLTAKHRLAAVWAAIEISPIPEPLTYEIVLAAAKRSLENPLVEPLTLAQLHASRSGYESQGRNQPPKLGRPDGPRLMRFEVPRATLGATQVAGGLTEGDTGTDKSGNR